MDTTSAQKKKIIWVLFFIGLIIVGTVGYYGYSVLHFANEIQKQPKESIFKKFATPVNEKNEPPKWEGKARVNILLLGGDSRGLEENEIPRSDSIMVASFDPVTKQACLFSILRDTYVDIPGHNSQRINAAITLGGPQLAMETISNFLGIPIQYYVYTDFQGFIALIDSLGGMDYEVEKNMKYSDSGDDHKYDIDLKKGMQHLDGNTALQYVRFRHDAMSDYARTERQRKFLQAIAAKLQTTLSIIKLPRILNSIDPYIETNLSIMEMIKLANLGYESKAEGAVSAQLPPTELLVEDNIGGASVITVDPEKLKQFVQSQFNRSVVDNNTTTPEESMENGQAQSAVDRQTQE